MSNRIDKGSYFKISYLICLDLVIQSFNLIKSIIRLILISNVNITDFNLLIAILNIKDKL